MGDQLDACLLDLHVQRLPLIMDCCGTFPQLLFPNQRLPDGDHAQWVSCDHFRRFGCGLSAHVMRAAGSARSEINQTTRRSGMICGWRTLPIATVELTLDAIVSS
jgi:hypothetical protein